MGDPTPRRAVPVFGGHALLALALFFALVSAVAVGPARAGVSGTGG